MKKILMTLLLSIFSFAPNLHAGDPLISPFFERPINCPLRFSSLGDLRDQMQSLVSSLGNGCSQNNQAALAQLNSNIANLEGIASSWTNFKSTDQKVLDAQLAKNINTILGSLSAITSSNSCFYDIRSRGLLPVLGDVIMSLSQIGLLIPTGPGMLVAAGGYVAGSGLKIINQLIKKKYNFSKPEERKAFLQLNCAFFDNRRLMEEGGIFNPETETYREEMIMYFRREKSKLIKIQRKNEIAIPLMEKNLADLVKSIADVGQRGLDPILTKQIDDLSAAMATRPADYAAKLRQVTALSIVAGDMLNRLKALKIEGPEAPTLPILINSLSKIVPDLAVDGKAWTCTIDEYELLYRGPLMAFLVSINQNIKTSISKVESENSVLDEDLSKKITKLRTDLNASKIQLNTTIQRINSVETKINSLISRTQDVLFSEKDEGKSDFVEILQNYRTLQESILGKEGKGYLKNSLRTINDMENGLDEQLYLYMLSKEGKERCGAAEKLRFAWAQYRYKVQETYDFVATNLDLYRSNFRIGKEKLKRSTKYVLKQIDSVDGLSDDIEPEFFTVGSYMKNVQVRLEDVEKKIHESKCFKKK